jgi:hypothetical protein
MQAERFFSVIARETRCYYCMVRAAGYAYLVDAAILGYVTGVSSTRVTCPMELIIRSRRVKRSKIVW